MKVTASDEALRELRAALGSAGGDGSALRLEVSAGYQYDLFFGDPEAGDVVTDLGGLALRLDPRSAERADGLHINWVAGPGGGFKMENPNEPAKVQQLAPSKLKEMMDRGERFELVDVRTPEEWAIARIAGARLMDHALSEELDAMDRGTTLVFQCHHGVRSRHAAERYVLKGFRNVYNLQGGIDGWSASVDRTVPRY